MSTPVAAARPRPAAVKKRWWAGLTGGTLWLSILIHVFLAVGATIVVVEHISAKKRVTFSAAPPPAPPVEVEHKVEMAKKNDSGSAPPDMKRITTTDVSQISLPDVPDTPVTDEATPVAMSGAGDLGEGMGSGAGDGNGDGGSPFGIPDSTVPELKGSLYDLKQTNDRLPTKMDPKGYHQVLMHFVANAWGTDVLDRYYKSKSTLSTSSIYIPTIHAVDGPKAFGVESEVQPRMYVVWYKVRAAPTEDGTYHFVGIGDDILLVRLDGQTVLDGSISAVDPGLWGQEKRYRMLDFKTNNSTEASGLFVGVPVHLHAHTPVDLEVLIGEEPGGFSSYFLYIQRDESSYVTQSNNTPLLPIFQLGTKGVHPSGESSLHPPFSANVEPWEAAGSADVDPSGI